MSTTLPAGRAVQHVDAGVDGVAQTGGVAELQILERANQVVAIVGERAAELDLVAEGPDLALVIGKHPRMNCSVADLSRSRFAVMLALKSSMTTTVNGCVSFWKNEIACGFPVVRDREFVLFEVRDEPSLRVDHRGEHGHDARARLEGGLLREEYSPRPPDRKRQCRKRPPESHKGA